MSERPYSLASLDRQRFLPLRAALAATVFHDNLEVTVLGRQLQPEDADSALKNHQAIEFPVVFKFQRQHGSISVTLRAVFSVLFVEVTPDSDETKRVHELVRDTLVL